MRYPKFLEKQGTIGFVAPSFGCNIEPYRTAFGHAQEILTGMGHSIALGPNCYEGSGIGISNTPKACGEELTSYYCSGDNDVLISCGGGELMCEDLDFVDFERICGAQPKWYMGYSDNTNFTFLLTTLCDTASMYGPCAAAFGMEPWHPAIWDAYQLLTGEKLVQNGYPLWEKDSRKDEEHPLAPYNATESRILKLFPSQHINMHGRLLGGCLDILVMLLGTKYDKVREFADRYQEDGIIWFLESCDLNVMSIRRALWQMEHAGWFEHVKGFIIGRPLCHGEELMGLDQYQAVLGILEKFQVPIIMDADLGHIPPMMPLICGSVADIAASGNEISVEMNLI